MKHVDVLCWSIKVRKHFFRYPHRYRLVPSPMVLDITVVARSTTTEEKDAQGYQLLLTSSNQ